MTKSLDKNDILKGFGRLSCLNPESVYKQEKWQNTLTIMIFLEDLVVFPVSRNFWKVKVSGNRENSKILWISEVSRNRENSEILSIRKCPETGKTAKFFEYVKCPETGKTAKSLWSKNVTTDAGHRTTF